MLDAAVVPWLVVGGRGRDSEGGRRMRVADGGWR